jgi:hypothetical protein
MSTDEAQQKKRGLSWPVVLLSAITVPLAAVWVINTFF